MQINEKIRALREDRDLKQATIGALLGVNQSYYSKQERGDKPFQIEHIKILCQYYGISADYLLGLPKGLQWPR